LLQKFKSAGVQQYIFLVIYMICIYVCMYVCMYIMILLNPRISSNHETDSIISQVLQYQVSVIASRQVYQYQALVSSVKC